MSTGSDVIDAVLKAQAAQAKWADDLMMDLYVQACARSDYMQAKIGRILDTFPGGGTTNEYERCLAAINNFLYPTPEDLKPFEEKIRERMS